MPKSFSLKTIQITVTLGNETFSEGGNTKIIEGLACTASVLKPGLPEKNSASVKIWGLNYDAMRELTVLSYKPLESLYNTITVKAGERGKPLALVFSGEIVNSFADFNQSPDPCMQFEADSGSYPQQIAEAPTTVKGEARADHLFAQFAGSAGYSYKNEGVTASVMNAWFSGSPIDKMSKLARDIGCELLIDDGVVVTMPAGQARAGVATLLNKDTGLIGYPTFTQDGISCRCIFNHNLVQNGLIKVESMVPRAPGVWRIINLSHQLSAYMPGGGNWESQIEAVYND